MRQILPVQEIPRDLTMFNGIDDDAKEQALACLQATYIAYDAGEVIRESDTAQNFTAILVEGRADGYVYDEDGNRSLLHLFLPGQIVSYGRIFGAPSWSSFDVVARDNCKLILFNADHVVCADDEEQHALDIIRDNLMKLAAELDSEIMATLTIRLRRTIRGKVLAFLEYEEARQGSSSFDIAFNRQELADYLCVDRAALSRELSALRAEGHFEFDRNHFDVHIKPKTKVRPRAVAS